MHCTNTCIYEIKAINRFLYFKNDFKGFGAIISKEAVARDKKKVFFISYIGSTLG